MRYWRKLDNAAKIFPSAANRHDTNVFRVYSELKEDIDKDILQKAVDISIKDYPVFCSVMKKGLFWYYLEDTKIRPIVKEEYKKPCSAIYDKDVKKLLFEVTYFKKRINLEVYHVLMDGTGAISFLKTIVSNYLKIKYSIKIDIDIENSATYEKEDDSYKKFYEKDKSRNNKACFAYKLKGEKTSKNQLKIVEGALSTSKLKDLSGKYNCTITAYLIGVLLKAIYEEMPISDRKKQVVVSVPVNLRKYFESETARNFFGVLFIKYNFSKQSEKLEDIIEFVSKELKNELKSDKIKLRMNALISVERNPIIRVVPLLIKNLVLKIAFRITEIYETTTISNIGRIELDDEFSKYVSSFGMYPSTNSVQLGICSFLDTTTIIFSSCYINTNVQRRFFKEITDSGLKVVISSNY